MAMQYINSLKGKVEQKVEQKRRNPSDAQPVLNDEDEKFLERITSEEAPPPLPERPVVILDNGGKVGKCAQTALMAGANEIPLPTSPTLEGELNEGKIDESKDASADGKKKKDYWSYVPNIRFGKVRNFKAPIACLTGNQGKGKEAAAAQLQAAADAVKSGEKTTIEEDIAAAEAKKEQEDMASILDQLNLSAVNNRAFSFSKESQKLMEEFTQILKDIVNGVPTAYDDLEKLLTQSEGQLTKLFAAMPPFLQALVKSLPAKMTAGLAPEILAATSEKPGFDAKMAAAGSAGAKKARSNLKIPSLKSLVGQKGAVATMLRSILNFLKLRFPAVLTGTNVLMSLAVFLLLFVFWYCHKRGKETRLAKEKEAGSDGESNYASEMDESTVLEKEAGDVEPPIKLNDSLVLEEKPSAALEDLEDVLNQPEPSKVPLPTASSEARK
ncbi:hypothetical protein E6O75_ATG04455 [Venturia nashicola]|uniref:Uncharacterized protein n=1 Tax=Venturia nashicola TaxID=86259 RepID=A0A4Z1PNE6_9PEZI|nr:hypothetical protein E6O75_ATG04455 [Venturia nashicola]